MLFFYDLSTNYCDNLKKMKILEPPANWKDTNQAKPKNKPVQCDECGKMLKGQWNLKEHKDMHKDIRRFNCLICGYAFRRKPHLKAHLQIHEGVKPFKCQFCEARFFLNRDLARHENSHTGHKPNPCTFPGCTKSFNIKQHLNMHLKTHTKERNYHCQICQKSFTQANSLRVHRKRHETLQSDFVPREKQNNDKLASVESRESQPQPTSPSLLSSDDLDIELDIDLIHSAWKSDLMSPLLLSPGETSDYFDLNCNW